MCFQRESAIQLFYKSNTKCKTTVLSKLSQMGFESRQHFFFFFFFLLKCHNFIIVTSCCACLVLTRHLEFNCSKVDAELPFKLQFQCREV